MEGQITYNKLIEMLGDNYRKVESSIANQILLNVDNHYATVGSYRENVWKSLFEMIIPKKYCIEQGVFIIDSYGHKSKEVDLVIFDEMYTPYIFNYGEIKFIPIEAVAAVVQCKSHTVDYDNVSEWRKTIEDLFTSLDSVARMAIRMIDNKSDETARFTQTATRPIMILCAIEPIEKIKELKNDFDIILSVKENDYKLHKYIRGENNSLKDWNDSLNHDLGKRQDDSQEIIDEKDLRAEKEVDISENWRKDILQNLKVMQANEDGVVEENVLLSLIFQLNQLLMILNNPMLFPHHAYAYCFNTILKEAKKGEKDGQQK